MAYYAWVRDGQFIGVAECRLADGDNLAISQELFEDAKVNHDKYTINLGTLVVRDEWPDIEAERFAEQALLDAKSARAVAVASITVTVDGMVFDGDEKAQERMARTVTAAASTGASMEDTTVWVLHDNTVATPTIRQLATALRLAGEAQTRLWTVPYEASYIPAEAA